MTIRDRISRLLGRDSPRVSTQVSVIQTAVLNMSAVELYRSQPALQAVISFLAVNAAHLPIKCYVRNSDTDRERDTSSTLALLFAQPSAYQTAHELVRDVASDYYLHGWALCVIEPSLVTRSGWSIVHIPTAWLNGKGDTYDGLEPCTYHVNNPITGKCVDLDAADCIRFYNYDPLGGTEPNSPVGALKQVLSEQISAWNFRNSVWKNGGRVTQTLNRPKDAPPWSPESRDRFAKSWKLRFAGEGGTDTGGTPLLEDGMTLNTVQFNAREAEWTEATRLTREDVAAIYHVNPALIWHTEGQTYASAKDNARALYADTLAPFLDMFEERINAFLVPKLGLDSTHYVEFDMSAKLAASYEELVSVLQSAVGAPFVLANEARAKINLPAIEGGDTLIRPLNVDAVGQTEDEPEELEEPEEPQPETSAAVVETKTVDDMPAPDDEDFITVKFNEALEIKAEKNIDETLQRFFRRQGESVVNRIASSKPEDLIPANPDDIPTWYQAERWENELKEDLNWLMGDSVMEAANNVLETMGVDKDVLKRTDVTALSRQICGKRAHQSTTSVLEKTLAAIVAIEATEITPELAAAAARESFETLNNSRVSRNAGSIATTLVNAGTMLGAEASGKECWKYWHAFPGARKSHARMNGQRRKLENHFSNGGRYPGDTQLPPEESCNCRCRMDVIARK